VSICGGFNKTHLFNGVCSPDGRPLSAKASVTGRMVKQFAKTGQTLLKLCHNARSQSPLKLN
jgi:hypothetical protein